MVAVVLLDIVSYLCSLCINPVLMLVYCSIVFLVCNLPVYMLAGVCIVVENKCRLRIFYLRLVYIGLNRTNVADLCAFVLRVRHGNKT